MVTNSMHQQTSHGAFVVLQPCDLSLFPVSPATKRGGKPGRVYCICDVNDSLKGIGRTFTDESYGRRQYNLINLFDPRTLWLTFASRFTCIWTWVRTGAAMSEIQARKGYMSPYIRPTERGVDRWGSWNSPPPSQNYLPPRNHEIEYG